MTATYADGSRHYDRHNLYGLEESMATQAALADLPDFQEEPPFLLTRCASSATCSRLQRWQLA